MRHLALAALATLAALAACSAPLPNRAPTGEALPEVRGEALDGRAWTLPRDWRGEPVVAVLGFVQDSQFDIDRWLIGLDMTQTAARVYEVPTIRGLAPRVFSAKINEGMRGGIPRALWGGVITVYADGERLQRFTGSERPRNARVLLLDAEGVVRYFNDEGFSVGGLNALRAALAGLGGVKGGAQGE
ncbi:MAG: hypothetical protein FJ138_14510 [Deltaproteobacteria bacterium]|nr:hypothetical protein [Deltaproteobacteria bacterium]